MTLTVLQISDVHLRREVGDRLLGVDTWDSVVAVLDQALGERSPDALLVTGDVAHDPEPRVYARFKALLAERFSGPVLMLPGNHDVLAAMGELPAALELDGWTVLALDSHVDDEPQAEVDQRELSRLQEACRTAAGEHVLVATHHPPVDVGCPWLDKDRIQNGEELLEWLSGHGAVKAMVFGHAHQIVETSYRHISLLGTPSTCFQFAPRSERFAIDVEQPGYRWLQLGADGSVGSEVVRLDDYALNVDLTQFRKKE